MTRASAALAVLLAYAIVTIWINGRGARSLFQCAVFLRLAGWAAMCRAGLGLVQLATQRTVYRWATWLAIFFLALQIFQPPAARRWFLRFALYFGFGLSVAATVQNVHVGCQDLPAVCERLFRFRVGLFVYRNQYAAFLETMLPIALWDACATATGCRPIVPWLRPCSRRW